MEIGITTVSLVYKQDNDKYVILHTKYDVAKMYELQIT